LAVEKNSVKVAVTGAFGYPGRYIAQRLLESGHEVITLTNSCLVRLALFPRQSGA
jgi:nucleoside-diphosphate-sugar epimerase